MVSVTVQEALSIAVEHHKAGRLAQAESVYREVLKVQPSHPDALHLLGLIENGRGNHDAAIDLIGRAVAANPALTGAHHNLGGILVSRGRFDEGVASFLHAVALQPALAGSPQCRQVAQGLLNRAHQQRGAGALGEAKAALDRARALAPAHTREVLRSLSQRGDIGLLDVLEVPSDPASEELARFYVPSIKFSLHLGSGCNLRCDYCIEIESEDDRNEKHKKIAARPLEDVERDIELIEALGVDSVFLTGWGEVTIRPHWMEVANRLVDAGKTLTVISNFAKRFKPEELKTLARFQTIIISCDTVDKEMARIIRNPLNIDIMFDNIQALREIAPYPGPPFLQWNAVVTDLVVHSLPDWVTKGTELGIGHFNVNSIKLNAYTASQRQAPRHLAELSPEERERARHSIMRAQAIAAENKRGLWIGEDVKGALLGVSEMNQEGRKISYTPLAPGMSRHCLSPWNTLSVGTDIGVCCEIGNTPIPSRTTGDVQNQLRDDPFLVDLRRGLIEGKPLKVCQTCRIAPPVDAAVVRRRVRALRHIFS